MISSRQSHDRMRRLRLFSPGDVTYALASLLLSSLQWIPASRRIRVINTASTILGGFLYVANVHSTRMIRENLHAVLGLERSPDRIEADVRQLLSMTVWNALTLNILPLLPSSQIVKLAQIGGTSHLDDCLASERPVLIWSYHFGVQPLIVAAMIHARGYPIHTITHVRQAPVSASVFRRRYLDHLRHIGEHFSVIDPREGLQRKMLDVLRNNECLYVTPDYMIAKDQVNETKKSVFEVPIDFLNRKTYLQTGSLRLAKRLKAKVITVLLTQSNGSERRLIIEPFELPTIGFTPTELQQDLQMCLRRLESRVRACPYLWLDLKRNDLLKRLI